jgi:endonuclease YncB( thermonuclease family)
MRRGIRVLEGLEKEAREAKKGLWADPAPISPWEYRAAPCVMMQQGTARLFCR